MSTQDAADGAAARSMEELRDLQFSDHIQAHHVDIWRANHSMETARDEHRRAHEFGHMGHAVDEILPQEIGGLAMRPTTTSVSVPHLVHAHGSDSAFAQECRDREDWHQRLHAREKGSVFPHFLQDNDITVPMSIDLTDGAQRGTAVTGDGGTFADFAWRAVEAAQAKLDIAYGAISAAATRLQNARDELEEAKAAYAAAMERETR